MVLQWSRSLLSAVSALAVFAIGGLLAPAKADTSSALKPVVVISIASIDESVADISYILSAIGKADQAGFVTGIINTYADGLDKSRPLGAYLAPRDGEFKFVAFIPVKNLTMIMDRFKGTLRPKDIGEGVTEIAVQARSAFIRESNGWAFVSDSASNLKDLPADPATLLGDLPTKYNISAKAFVQNVPAEMRDWAIEQIREGMDKGLEQQRRSGRDQDLAEGIEQTTSSLIRQIEQMIKEGEELAFGVAIDAAKKQVSLDFKNTAIAGSSLAKSLENQKEGPTNFGGFSSNMGAVQIGVVSKASPEDIERGLLFVETLRKASAKQIDEDKNLNAEERTFSKGITGEVFDLVADTIKQGTMDLGGTVEAGANSLSIAAGFSVSDGTKLESILKRAKEAKIKDPDFPSITPNVDTISGISIHKIEINVPSDEEQSRKLFGEKAIILVGTSPKAIYISLGTDSEKLLRRAVDKSLTSAKPTILPSQAEIHVKPLLRLAASIAKPGDREKLEAFSKGLESVGGNDAVYIRSVPLPRGIRAEIVVPEDLLRMLGATQSSPK